VATPDRTLTALDALYLQRAYELAGRGVGSTSPNPPVGALVVRDGMIVGEGYHRLAGAPHAEVHALRRAGPQTRGATVYVSLEPCGHVGRTPPCTRAIIEAGVARVVAGTFDASHGGADQLRDAGIDVTIAHDAAARVLIEPLERSRADRPFVALKMAMSLDGAVARRPGVREQLGSPGEERYVRELRVAHDAVMVGAGTVRVDDPQLTVRPAHDRARPYQRIVVCGREPVSPASRVFESVPGYSRTIVLAPAGVREPFLPLKAVADVVVAGEDDATALDLRAALKLLRDRGIASVLCEGGPTLAASLLASSLVDRLYWAIAPRFLHGETAVPVLRGAGNLAARVRFDRVELAGDDAILSGTCSAES
jgi:diaminohydroxyphosphoribosylaminopyrimidine deaminase/5-amino-6-(5-phosphoribosylamino)uracil reductase